MKIQDPLKYWEIIDVELGHVFITYNQENCAHYEEAIKEMGHRSLVKEVIPR